MRHINVILCDQFIGCVHRNDGNAEVYDVDIVRSDEFRDCSAAAEVDLSKLSHLPDNVGFVEDSCHKSDKFRSRVGCAGLTARACIF